MVSVNLDKMILIRSFIMKRFCIIDPHPKWGPVRVKEAWEALGASARLTAELASYVRESSRSGSHSLQPVGTHVLPTDPEPKARHHSGSEILSSVWKGSRTCGNFRLFACKEIGKHDFDLAWFHFQQCNSG